MEARPGLGRRTWVLIALAAVIVVMVIILIAISVTDGRAAESSSFGMVAVQAGAWVTGG